MHNYSIYKQADFLDNRRSGLGASDMAILAGFGKRYTREVEGVPCPVTPHVLWLEKTGNVDNWTDTPATYWGSIHEAAIIRHFESLYGVVGIQKTEFHHPDLPWAYSHPDLLYADSGKWKIQEIKTGGYFAAKRRVDSNYGYDPEDLSENGIPASVYIQVQWQLFTSGLKEAWVSALIDTSDYREYGPIRKSPKVVKLLVEAGIRFWWHVKKNKPLQPEHWRDVQLLFPDIKKNALVVSGEHERRIEDIKERSRKNREKIKKLKAVIDEDKTAIALYLGDNQVITSGTGDKLAGQSTFKKESLSLKDLKKEDPRAYEMIKKYIRVTDIRRITW